MFFDLEKSSKVIGGFHISGKGHKGDFDDLFKDNKEYFLNKFKNLTSQIENTVYVVPEIFKQTDFENIMKDILVYNIFKFRS